MIKKYNDFLLEDVTQNNLKNKSVSSDDSVDTKKVVTSEDTENKKQVENNVKTETIVEGDEKPAEGEKPKVEGGEKPAEAEKLDISPESTKVSKYIYDFYNRLGLSLKSLGDMRSRNTNDVQQKNSELKTSGVKQQPEQPTQQPEQPEVEKDMTKRQLGFKKDSTEQLKAKLNNPLYAKYKNEINAVLSDREKIKTTNPKVNVKEQPNIGNV